MASMTLGLGLGGFVQLGHDQIKTKAAFVVSNTALDGVALARILVHLALEFGVRFVESSAAQSELRKPNIPLLAVEFIHADDKFCPPALPTDSSQTCGGNFPQRTEDRCPH